MNKEKIFALPVTTCLDGRYVIQRLLDHDDITQVYLAQDKNLKSLVLIKEFFPVELASRTQGKIISALDSERQEFFEEGKKRFIDEASILAELASLDHPNLVKIVHVFQANNTAYIVTPYYAGTSLKRMQASSPKLWQELELKALLAPLLNALQFLHEQNILHRDITPENIFIKKNGQPIFLEIGSARQFVREVSQNHINSAQQVYSPIEQNGENRVIKQGPWSNIYSLAAVAYELACGEKTFAAKDRVLTDQMPSLKQKNLSHFNQRFICAIDKALSVKVKDRPQSINEWRKLLGFTFSGFNNLKLHQSIWIIFGVFLLTGTLIYFAMQINGEIEAQKQKEKAERIKLENERIRQAEERKERLRLEEEIKETIKQEEERIAALVQEEEIQKKIEEEKQKQLNNPVYQFNLGVKHQDKGNIEEAIEWYTKAAKQDNTQAQYNLALLYEILGDYVQAVFWFRKAAELGEPSAQNNLGVMYNLGKGVLKDRELAIEWWRKAANNGSEIAKENLELFNLRE